MCLFISMSRRSAIVSPASEMVRPTMTESWLGAPKQRTATVVCGGVRCSTDYRWTSCVTTWRTYDMKRRQERPLKAVDRRPGQIMERHEMARGHRETGEFGDGMLGPPPNHGTLRLPNDYDHENEETWAFRCQWKQGQEWHNYMEKPKQSH